MHAYMYDALSDALRKIEYDCAFATHSCSRISQVACSSRLDAGMYMATCG